MRLKHVQKFVHFLQTTEFVISCPDKYLVLNKIREGKFIDKKGDRIRHIRWYSSLAAALENY